MENGTLLRDVAVVIPAYQPDEKLINTIEELIAGGFGRIVVVDDGSDASCEALFAQAVSRQECILLRHEQNRGKGAALKTALAYYQEHPELGRCLVTVDADGQHLTEDIKAVCRQCLQTGKVILGVRNFADAGVPARSIMGNRITSAVFRLFFGMRIRDTQTGLRAFPAHYIRELTAVEGDRYEYETNVLLMMNRLNIPFEQCDITTVYIEENKSSHFRVIRDSVRIYALIFKYLFSSVGAAVIDELAFYVFKKFALLAFVPIPLTFSAAILARIISSLFNFWMNAKHVFKDKVNASTFGRYYLLAAVQILLSALLVFVAEHLLQITSPALSTLAKTLIDTGLFFVSFRVQHKWVFNSAPSHAEAEEEDSRKVS